MFVGIQTFQTSLVVQDLVHQGGPREVFATRQVSSSFHPAFTLLKFKIDTDAQNSHI